MDVGTAPSPILVILIIARACEISLILLSDNIVSITYTNIVGLGGLGVPCSSRDPRFAGSNPTDVDGFFRT